MHGMTTMTGQIPKATEWPGSALAALPLPAWEDGRIRLAADVSNWLRPDAEASPQRLFCHCCPRGKGNAQMIPGWPYSFVVAVEPVRNSTNTETLSRWR
jgi:hypothetical protein